MFICTENSVSNCKYAVDKHTHTYKSFDHDKWLNHSILDLNEPRHAKRVLTVILIKIFIFRAQELKAPVTYCDHALSVVRRVVCMSSIRQFTFSTSSPEPLDRFWWNLVWMKYWRSLTSVVVFRPDPPRGGSRAGQKMVMGVPFFRKLLLQTGRLQQQTECIAVIYNHVGKLVSFGSQIFDAFLTSFWT